MSINELIGKARDVQIRRQNEEFDRQQEIIDRRRKADALMSDPTELGYRYPIAHDLRPGCHVFLADNLVREQIVGRLEVMPLRLTVVRWTLERIADSIHARYMHWRYGTTHEIRIWFESAPDSIDDDHEISQLTMRRTPRIWVPVAAQAKQS